MQEIRIEDMSLELSNLQLTVNLTTPFALVKAALPYLREIRGTIVNIGSVAVLGANPRHAADCASEARVHGLTRVVATDHGGEGLRRGAVVRDWTDMDLNVEFIKRMP